MHKNTKPHFDGERFGMLTLIEQDPIRGNRGRIKWLCRCDCGEVRSVMVENLMSGHSTSCGCVTYARSRAAREALGQLHGGSETSEYEIWSGMRKRCLNRSSHAYASYGGRGIAICPEWDSFPAFLRDMGARPSVDYTLERINNDGPYSPENCRWATRKEQARNRRNSRFVTYLGRTQTLSAWAEEVGIKRATLEARLKRGVPVEIAFSNRPSHL